jgi:hypothetical protein
LRLPPSPAEWEALKAENAKLRAEVERLLQESEEDFNKTEDQLSALVKERDVALLQARDWEKAVNVWCSCGGRSPNDAGACMACRVYHTAKGIEAPAAEIMKPSIKKQNECWTSEEVRQLYTDAEKLAKDLKLPDPPLPEHGS